MRKINRAVKVRIYPNAEQRVQIEKTIGCSRFIYNCMLADKMEHYKKEKKMLRNTPASYKKEYPWLKEVDSLALANAQMHLESAFHKFFREPSAGFPRFKSKKYIRCSTAIQRKSLHGNRESCPDARKAVRIIKNRRNELHCAMKRSEIREKTFSINSVPVLPRATMQYAWKI